MGILELPETLEDEAVRPDYEERNYKCVEREL